MNNTQSNVPEGCLLDPKGRAIHKTTIDPIDLARNELVQSIVEKGLTLKNALKTFKDNAMGDIGAFVDLSTEQYGVTIGGKKGNISLTSFDGQYQVRISVNDKLTFDERIHAAKALIDECLQEWTEGSPDELRSIIDDAFAVDKEGKINAYRILTLRRIKSDNPKWKRAMEALADSLQVQSSTEYLRIYKRNPQGKYEHESLDLAGV